jgi:DNA-binding response OmpR family regulator
MTTPRVLVVEDDPNVRGLMQILLEAEGYAVTTASDGLDALGQAAVASPALVLLDLVMPDLGGVRVLERLREDPVLARIPVIVVTGHEEAVPDVRAVLGHDNVFLKPFAVAELLHRVGAVTGGPS